MHPLFDILVDALRPTPIVYDEPETETIDVDCEIVDESTTPNNQTNSK